MNSRRPSLRRSRYRRTLDVLGLTARAALVCSAAGVMAGFDGYPRDALCAPSVGAHETAACDTRENSPSGFKGT